MNENNVMINCPKCNSNKISLDISLGKLKCEYCGTVIENQQYKKELNNVDNLEGQLLSEGSSSINNDVVNLVKYKCASCNSIIIQDEKRNDLKCPWCHSDLVKDNDSSFTPVKKILPFLVNKETAINNMKKHLDTLKKYIPSDIIKMINPNNMIPIYIPYTLMDVELSGDFSGVGEHLVDSKRDRENHTTTFTVDSYSVKRKFDLKLYHVYLEDQNLKITDDDTAIKNMITALNPYDTAEVVDFDNKYVKDSILGCNTLAPPKDDAKLNEKLLSISKCALSKSISYYDRGVRWEKLDINVNNTSYNEVYLPVWLYYFTIDNNKYYIAVNGRTEEITVHIPCDKFKIIGSSLLIGLCIILGVSLLLFFFIWFPSIVSSILGTSFSVMDPIIGLPLLFIIIIGLLIATIIVIFRSRSKIYQYLGSNRLNENDSLVKNELVKVETEDKIINSFKTKRFFVSGKNN